MTVYGILYTVFTYQCFWCASDGKGLSLVPVPDTAGIERVCLRDAAYARLRDWIVDGTLAPGEPLRDEPLAEALGMSRTPVREAMQRLVEDGLVTISANRRAYVSTVSIAQAREIFPIVAQLETLAIALALPAIDGEALDAMRTANRALAGALEAQDTNAALEADTMLHSTFIARAGNQELEALLREEKSKVMRLERTFWGSADRSDSLQDHEELIEALAAHDCSRAQHVIRRNWDRGLAWLGRSAQPAREQN